MSRRFLTPVNLPKGNSLPLSGIAGDLFFKLDEQKIYVHNGTDWVVAQGSGGGTTVSATPPSNPTEGDTWFDSTVGKSYVYYDNTWVDVSVGSVGPAGPTGATGATGAVGPTGPAGEGVTAMSLLTDVELTDIADNQVLLYQENISKWVNVDADALAVFNTGLIDGGNAASVYLTSINGGSANG